MGDAPEIRRHELAGWPAITLAGPSLAVTVLPSKGADIVALVDRATGVDALFHAPWGLQPPGAPAREGSDGHAFLANYEGGWQLLLPNTNDACEHAGRSHRFHGDVATMPWRVVDAGEDADRVRVELAGACDTLPLVVQRRLVVGPGDALAVHDTVRNTGDADVEFVFGHHCVLGAPLVGAGAHLRTAARTLATPSEPWEPTARLEPGQAAPWPYARGRDGGRIDLREIPGPEAGSHDDVFLSDLDAGWAEVDNPALGLRFRLEWDPEVLRSIVSWQPYGGARALPLAGSYALGVEPWRFPGTLAAAAAAGEALVLAPGAELATTVVARFGAAIVAPVA